MEDQLGIKEIYELFDKIGSVTFATIRDGYPETRIAHFFAYDDEGLYFRTMFTKPFYKQLKAIPKVSVCGLYGNTGIDHDEDGLPTFDPGYTIRVSGDTREVSYDEIKAKGLEDKRFDLGAKDGDKYPAMRFFVLETGGGEVYDYDFEKESRDHKLLRNKFQFRGLDYKHFELEVTQKCIGCKRCIKRCSFDAIRMVGKMPTIDPSKCDVCGDCVMICPADAIKEKA